MRDLLIALAAESGRTAVADELRPADPMPPPAPEVEVSFVEALRQTQKGGSLAKAARTIETALKKMPDDVACLGLAVMIHTMRGDRALAESCGRRATALAPRVAALHTNLGNCLRDQRKYEDALSCYEQAFTLAPEIIQTHFNIAQCLGQLGRREEAKAIWHNVLALPAETLPARFCRAAALVALDRLKEAEPLLTQILIDVPTDGTAKMELATVYRRTRRPDQALALLSEIVRAEPGNWAVRVQLAVLYQETGRLTEAEATVRKALELNPGDPNSLIVLAQILGDGTALKEAEDVARDALSREPGDGLPSHLHVLGIILERQGRYDEAGKIFETVAAAEPDKAWAHIALAFHFLRQGDFRRGWAEHEWRWRWERNPDPPPNYPQPQWTPSARKNSRVLVWSEQGLGDSIQFSRFIPMIAKLGYQPILGVQPAVKKLLAENFSLPTLAYGEKLPEFEYQIPFLSLCHALGVSLEDIPGRHGYLRAEDEAAAKWRSRLRSDGRLLVGLNWAGNPQHINDARRSIPVDRLEPILNVDRVRFISLQKETRERDRPAMARFAERLDTALIEHSEDLADTAALIANLDLVISIDGGVAHLAGAMGKPVWMLVPSFSDWRWMVDREDTPWYESLSLFRQVAVDDWTAPMKRVVDELRRKARAVCDHIGL